MYEEREEIKLKRRTRSDLSNKKYVDVNELREIISLGRNNCMKLGADAGAVIRIGKRTLYNIDKILDYMDNIAERGEDISG